MITYGHFSGYRSVADLRLEFAPFTILTGGSNAGKTAIVSCLAIATQSWRRPVFERDPYTGDSSKVPVLFRDEWELARHLRDGRQGKLSLEIRGEGPTGAFQYRLAIASADLKDAIVEEHLKISDVDVLVSDFDARTTYLLGSASALEQSEPKRLVRPWLLISDAAALEKVLKGGLPGPRERWECTALHNATFGTESKLGDWASSALDSYGPTRWTQAELSKPSGMITSSQWLDSGRGLPGALDSLRDRVLTAEWLALELAMKELFPELESFRLGQTEQLRVGPQMKQQKELFFKFAGAKLEVPGAGVSESMLRALGLLAMAFEPKPPALVLIDDFDRLHDRRVRKRLLDVFRVRMGRSDGRLAQIILTMNDIDDARDLNPDRIHELEFDRTAAQTRLARQA